MPVYVIFIMLVNVIYYTKIEAMNTIIHVIIFIINSIWIYFVVCLCWALIYRRRK